MPGGMQISNPTGIGANLNAPTNLPTVHRFYSEDYKQAPQWFQTFLSTLNLFSDPVYNALNNGLTVLTNLAEETFIFTITAGASATANTFLYTPKRVTSQPQGVWIVQAVLIAAVPTAIGNPVTLDWIFTNGQVKILAIYGLINGSQYTITCRLF